jgi:hypothetical protein
MLTLKECLDFCELSEEEIHAIAEHEHVPEIVAAGLGSSLLRSRLGIQAIQNYILDNIHYAQSQGETGKAEHLKEVLSQFSALHPPPGK